jgi:hypothetical protein
MTKKFVFAFFFLTMFDFSINQTVAQANSKKFATELTGLQAFFHIPAISVIIKKGDRIFFEDVHLTRQLYFH